MTNTELLISLYQHPLSCSNQKPKNNLFSLYLTYIIYQEVLLILPLKFTLNSFTFCHSYKPNANYHHLSLQLLPNLWLYLQNIFRIPSLLTPSLPSTTLFKPLSYQQDYYHSVFFFFPISSLFSAQQLECLLKCVTSSVQILLMASHLSESLLFYLFLSFASPQI